MSAQQPTKDDSKATPSTSQTPDRPASYEKPDPTTPNRVGGGQVPGDRTRYPATTE